MSEDTIVEVAEAAELAEACAELAPLYRSVRALEARALAASRRLVPALDGEDERGLVERAGAEALRRLGAVARGG